MITVHVDVSGPLVDGRALEALDEFEDAAKDELAQQGLADVQLILDRSIRNPTPYYETQVRTERVGSDRSVNDSGVIYGPWLEGTSSRNQTTRFKGYAAFRRAAQELNGAKGQVLVDRVLERYLPRMRGD